MDTSMTSEILCSICISNITDITDNVNTFSTHCNHYFHINCINTWARFNNNLSCPNCREPIQLTNSLIDNLDDRFYNPQDLHEDLIYALMIRDLTIFLRDFKSNYTNNSVTGITGVTGIINHNNNYFIFNYIVNALNTIIASIINYYQNNSLNNLFNIDKFNIDQFYNDINIQ